MTNVEHETNEASVPDVIRIDQEQIRSRVDQVVRSTVEETLNAPPAASSARPTSWAPAGCLSTTPPAGWSRAPTATAG